MVPCLLFIQFRWRIWLHIKRWRINGGFGILDLVSWKNGRKRGRKLVLPNSKTSFSANNFCNLSRVVIYPTPVTMYYYYIFPIFVITEIHYLSILSESIIQDRKYKLNETNEPFCCRINLELKRWLCGTVCSKLNRPWEARYSVEQNYSVYILVKKWLVQIRA